MFPVSSNARAERIRTLGGPEVLRFEGVPKPEPGTNEILLRVHAAGVNPVDWKMRQGLFCLHSLPSTGS
jgi:NADPH:quinone reductase-like Zn-dependent oxidoreductase